MFDNQGFDMVNLESAEIRKDDSRIFINVKCLINFHPKSMIDL